MRTRGLSMAIKDDGVKGLLAEAVQSVENLAVRMRVGLAISRISRRTRFGIWRLTENEVSRLRPILRDRILARTVISRFAKEKPETFKVWRGESALLWSGQEPIPEFIPALALLSELQTMRRLVA